MRHALRFRSIYIIRYPEGSPFWLRGTGGEWKQSLLRQIYAKLGEEICRVRLGWGIAGPRQNSCFQYDIGFCGCLLDLCPQKCPEWCSAKSGNDVPSIQMVGKPVRLLDGSRPRASASVRFHYMKSLVETLLGTSVATQRSCSHEAVVTLLVTDLGALKCKSTRADEPCKRRQCAALGR